MLVLDTVGLTKKLTCSLLWKKEKMGPQIWPFYTSNTLGIFWLQASVTCIATKAQQNVFLQYFKVKACSNFYSLVTFALFLSALVFLSIMDAGVFSE